MFKTAFSIISLNELNFTTPPSYLYNYIVSITIVVKNKKKYIIYRLRAFFLLNAFLEFIIRKLTIHFLLKIKII